MRIIIHEDRKPFVRVALEDHNQSQRSTLRAQKPGALLVGSSGCIKM